MYIEQVGFSCRTFNRLKRAGINTVEDLQEFDDEGLLQLRNIGVLSLEEIREKVPAIPREVWSFRYS